MTQSRAAFAPVVGVAAAVSSRTWKLSRDVWGFKIWESDADTEARQDFQASLLACGGAEAMTGGMGRAGIAGFLRGHPKPY